MARLRIRIELSRGGVGVPLHKLASVVDEAQKFFHMLAEDVHIERQRGEWLGFDFDNQSLNFTAEYVGAVTEEQVNAFYAAFDGTTSLRRATIAQFARITEAIGEEELIGFGLYQSEKDAEPSEWRCLSRRDALRITEEIQVLLGASEQESHLPAVSDAGSSLFGRAREDDSALAARLTRVERKVEQHSAQLQDLRSQSIATQESFRNLLTAVEGFCDQAARQIERVTPAALPPAPERKLPRWVFAGAAGLVAATLLIAGVRAWLLQPVEPVVANAAATEPPAVNSARPLPTPAPSPVPASIPSPKVTAPASEKAPAPHLTPMRIELDAADPSWAALYDSDGKKLYVGLVAPGAPHVIEVEHGARLRTGNAGGLLVKLNGKPLGTLGPAGMVRDVQFKDNSFKILTPQ